MTRPLSELRGPIRALFSDVDGTMTTGEAVEAATYAALEQLDVPVIVVTGRSAGFGDAIMRLTRALACVTENGGITFVRDGKKIGKRYGVPEASLADWRRRMYDAAADVMAAIPGTRYSSDSKYREVDLAIDWNEEVSLPVAEAERAATMLRAAGMTAVRSSVHVNFGPPLFDKLSACLDVVRDVLHADPAELAPYVYVGDALNDAPMFGGFPNSVGVANVAKYWDELPAKPAFITERAEGAGLRELVEHLRGISPSGIRSP